MNLLVALAVSFGVFEILCSVNQVVTYTHDFVIFDIFLFK